MFEPLGIREMSSSQNIDPSRSPSSSLDTSEATNLLMGCKKRYLLSRKLDIGYSSSTHRQLESTGVLLDLEGPFGFLGMYMDVLLNHATKGQIPRKLAKGQ